MAETRYQIQFQKSAYKEYLKLPKNTRSKVDEALEMLSVNPISDLLNFKKLRGREHHYRIRVGDYRIVYTPLHGLLIVKIIRVGHRKDVYRFF